MCVLFNVNMSHQEQPYQKHPGISRLTNVQFRPAVWSVSSYLTGKWLLRAMHKEIATDVGDGQKLELE